MQQPNDAIDAMCAKGVRLSFVAVLSAYNGASGEAAIATIPAEKMDRRTAQMILNVAHNGIVAYDYASTMGSDAVESDLLTHDTILFSILWDPINEAAILKDEDFETIAEGLGCAIQDAKRYVGLWHEHIHVIFSANNDALHEAFAHWKNEEERQKEIHRARFKMFTLDPIAASAKFNANQDKPTYAFVTAFNYGLSDWRVFKMPEECLVRVSAVTGEEYHGPMLPEDIPSHNAW
jgi:hypothetical protein